MGDSVCITPVFREMRKKLPNSFIVLLTPKPTRPVFDFNPYINQIIEIDNFKSSLKQKLRLVKKLRCENFDWVINLTPDVFNNLVGVLADIKDRVSIKAKGLGILNRLTSFFNNHILFYRRGTLVLDTYLKTLNFLGVKTNNRKKEIFFDKSIKKEINIFLDRQGIDNKKNNAIVSVGAGNVLKSWDLSKFAELSDWLIKNMGYRVVFIGGKKEEDKTRTVISLMKEKAINLSGFLSLHELFYLMQRGNLFVGLDTGPLYVANAFGVPVVDILGPVDKFSQPPIYEKCVVVRKKIYCQPCSFIFPAAHKCKEGHLRCLKETTVEDVKKAVEKLLKNNHDFSD